LKRIHYAKGKFALANLLVGAQVRDSSLLDPRYLFHYLSANKERLLVSLMVGTANVNLKVQDLHDVPIRFPDLPQQRRIVDLMSAVDHATDRAGELANAARLLWLSLSEDLWSTESGRTTIGALGRTSTGKTPPTADKANWGKHDVPFVTPGDLNGQLLLGDTARFVTSQGSKLIRSVGSGSVLQVCIGATIGKVAATTSTVTFNQQINAVELGSSDDAIVLAGILASPSGQKAVTAGAGKTTMPILKKSSWERVAIPWPTDAVRANVADLNRALVQVHEHGSQVREQTIHLRRALLAELLSGKHGIPDTYDCFLEPAS
jgi:type I restriction enzyme S subunit